MKESKASNGTKLKALMNSIYLRVGYVYYLENYVVEQADSSWDMLALEIQASIANARSDLLNSAKQEVQSADA